MSGVALSRAERAAKRAADLLHGEVLRPLRTGTGKRKAKLPTMFELARNLPNFGVGSKFTRPTWILDGKPPSCYWTITKVKPKGDGMYGKAWGVKTWNGEDQRRAGPNAANKKPEDALISPVHGANKKTWMILEVAGKDSAPTMPNFDADVDNVMEDWRQRHAWLLDTESASGKEKPIDFQFPDVPKLPSAPEEEAPPAEE